MRPRMLPAFLLLAAILRAQADGPAKPPAPYRVVKTLKVGGEGEWDLFALDSRTQRLYVPRSDHLIVVDAADGTIVGTLEDTPGVHGVALVPELERGFASNGRDESITVFDLKTLKVLGKVKAGVNPDAILYDPASKRVLCFNGFSRDVTIVDPSADFSKEVTPERLDLGGSPELGVADGKGLVYVSIADRDEVARIDTSTWKITARWPLKPGESPVGIALDPEHHRLFSGCENGKMVILDTETGKVLAALRAGDGVDGAAFDPSTGTAFTSNADGTLTVVRETSPGTFEVVQTLATRWGARTMVLDPTTHRIYLPTADFQRTAKGDVAPVPGSFMILVVDR
jgi:DNA-binding beta-propeller fold protein YncE